MACSRTWSSASFLSAATIASSAAAAPVCASQNQAWARTSPSLSVLPSRIRSAATVVDLDCVIAKARVLAHVRILVVEHHGGRDLGAGGSAHHARARRPPSCESRCDRLRGRLQPARSCATSPRCIASAASTFSPRSSCLAASPLRLESAINQRALSSVATFPSSCIGVSASTGHVADNTRTRSTLPPASARIHSHGVGGRVVAGAEVAAICRVDRTSAIPRDCPSCSSNTSPAHLRRPRPASSSSRPAAA